MEEMMKKLLNNVLYKKSNMPFFKRLFAYFIDWYIVSVLTIIPINFIYSITFQQKTFESTISRLPLFHAIVAFTIGLLFSFLYLIYYPYKKNGQTLGKKLFSIKIVKVNEPNLDLKTLLLRNGLGLCFIEGTLYTCSIYFWELMNTVCHASISSIVLNILSIITFISLFMILLTPQRIMLHDFIAHTRVVYDQK